MPFPHRLLRPVPSLRLTPRLLSPSTSTSTSTSTTTTNTISPRNFSTTLLSRFSVSGCGSGGPLRARKDTQDKDSINVESNEYSKSGGDGAAAHEESAFDGSKTSPEQTREEGGRGREGDPIDVSPGNPEVSKPRGAKEGGAERSPSEAAGERKSSGGKGSAAKNGGGKSG